MIVSSVLDGAKTTTTIGDKFVIETDQPPPFGADDAPSPFDFFLASFSACAAYFAQRYCRKWNLPHEGIKVELDPVFSAQHVLTDIHDPSFVELNQCHHCRSYVCIRFEDEYERHAKTWTTSEDSLNEFFRDHDEFPCGLNTFRDWKDLTLP